MVPSCGCALPAAAVSAAPPAAALAPPVNAGAAPPLAWNGPRELPKAFEAATAEPRIYQWCVRMAHPRHGCSEPHPLRCRHRGSRVQGISASRRSLTASPRLVVPRRPGPERRWQDNGFFKPDEQAPGEPFVISMPPPNVTGKLHMGHAMFATLQASARVGSLRRGAGSQCEESSGRQR